ncbi:MAG TPA: hypothetical protein VMT30_07505 [Candidatus Saccharimonadia bacterium]|nr:hypothetical protein [Candidatus Saccharimonadia bacterium]
MKLTRRGRFLIANIIGALGLLVSALCVLELYANAGRAISLVELNHPPRWRTMAFCGLGVLAGVGMMYLAWAMLRALYRTAHHAAASPAPFIIPTSFDGPPPVQVRFDIPPGSLRCEIYRADRLRGLPKPMPVEPLRIECTQDPTRPNR